MKRTILSLLFIGTFSLANAQNGLQQIIVEKYYISDENDTTTNPDGGTLPVGSVTYRIYADMLPGYKFQAAYGVPGHELRLATTTMFFNNEDRGHVDPTFSNIQIANNTVMLDSWLSAGAACADINGIPNRFGVLKAEDNGIATIVNADGVLQNTNPLAGIPLTSQDGLMPGAPEEVTLVGVDNDVTIFNNESNGSLFSTINGSWAALNGAVGPTASNTVLIAQITTDGIFSFELNIQIGTPSGGVQNFVARNPSVGEIQIPSLIYQNIPEMSVNIKAFIQGFYIGSGTMRASIDPDNRPNDADSLTLSLADANSPYDIVASNKEVLHIDGKAQFHFLRNQVGQSYYLVLNHRNTIETWSRLPLTIAANMFYDFSSASTQAYDDGFNSPMKLLSSSPVTYGLYSGDIDQDGGISSLDMTLEENDSNVGAFGYNPTDLDGDGASSSLDMTIIEDNTNLGVFEIHP